MKSCLSLLLLVAISVWASSLAHAADAPMPAPAPPRWEALRAGKVNMHTGPGMQYPVAWTFQRKNLPVRVLSSYDVWKKVSDADGTVGWVEDTMLTERRTVLVRAPKAVLRHDPQETAPGVAQAQPGTVARVIACQVGWCHVKFDGYDDGWMRQGQLWGTDPDEAFEGKR